MFTTKSLAEMSLEELKKQAQLFTTVSRVVGVVLLVLLIAFFVHLYQTGGSSGSSGSLAGFSALGISTALRQKKIKAEINQRTGIL